MKLSSHLFDSEYELHKFSAYLLFSGMLLDNQGKSMKTKLCVWFERIVFLFYLRDDWRMNRFSWKNKKKACQFFSFLFSNYELLTGQVRIPLYFTAVWPDPFVFPPLWHVWLQKCLASVDQLKLPSKYCRTGAFVVSLFLWHLLLQWPFDVLPSHFDLYSLVCFIRLQKGQVAQVNTNAMLFFLVNFFSFFLLKLIHSCFFLFSVKR